MTARKAPTRTAAARRSASPRSWWVWMGVGIAVIAVALGVALAGGGGGGEAKAGEVSPKIAVKGDPLPEFADNGLGTADDPGIGATAPTLTGQTFDGSITFANDGKARLVLFLAHWCPHCQAEVPLLVDLAKNGAFDGVDVQTIATGTDPAQVNYPPSEWLQREHWPFPVMADDGRYRAAAAYGLRFYPYFVLLDADGKVVGRATGEIDPEALARVLKALAAGNENPLAAA